MVVELIYCIKLPKRFQNHTQQRQGGAIEIKHISNPDSFSSLISQCFSFFDSRNTFYHPFGSRSTFEIMIKKAKHSGTQVHSVCPILIFYIITIIGYWRRGRGRQSHSKIIYNPNRSQLLYKGSSIQSRWEILSKWKFRQSNKNMGSSCNK